MKIQTNTNTDFKAKFIKSIQIQKLNNKKLYQPEQVSFIEIEPDNFEDVWALSQAAKNWFPEDYASNIAYNATLLFNKTLDCTKNKIYAITSQKDRFQTLDEFQLLALADIENIDNDSIVLNHLQVKPNSTNRYIERKYKYIGTKMLDALKNMYNNITLTSARGSVKNFYIKNGFICIDKEKNKFIWQNR